MTEVLKRYVLLQEEEGRELCMLLQILLEITVVVFMRAKCTACLTEEVKSYFFYGSSVGKIQSSNYGLCRFSDEF